MRKNLLFLMAFMFLNLVHAQDKKTRDAISYNGKRVELTEGAKQFSTLKSGGSAYVIMQFYELPNAAERKALTNKGVELYEYLGNNAYLARLNGNSLKGSGSSVRAIVSMSEVNKLAEELQRGEIPKCAVRPGEKVALVINFFSGVENAKLVTDLETLSAEDVLVSPFFDRLTCVIPVAQLNALNNLSWLKYAAPVEPEFESHYIKGNRQAGVSLVDGNIGAGRNLTGEGVKIGVWDGDVENHYDLKGRVNVHEYEMHETEHGIHVTGIMAGAGLIDPEGAGVANKATMETWNFNQGSNGLYSPEEMMMTARDEEIVITQNSYGVPHAGGFLYPYTSTAMELDQVAYDYPTLLHVFSAGNSRGANTYATMSQTAKNILTVAAIDEFNNMSSFSSWGPVHDGRLAPLISANGVDIYSCSYYDDYATVSGTSQATPLVSGIAAQLYELYKSKNGGNNPLSSLIKAAICNTAYDLGNEGPDFSYGFGGINAGKAADLIDEDKFFIGKVANEETRTMKIFVPAGVAQVKIMLAWTDPHAAAWGPTALVNDLDLSVSHGGKNYLPLVPNGGNPYEVAVEGEDHLNTIEQVVIKTPQSGYYEIKVAGTTIAMPEQDFSVVYTFDTNAIELMSPVGGEVFSPSTNVSVYWTAPMTNTNDFIIQLSKDGGKNYETVGQAGAASRRFGLNVGDEAFGNGKVRVIAGKYFAESKGVFSVMARPVIRAIDPELSTSKMEWDAVAGADAYNVYKLQDGEAVLVEQVTATEYILDARVATDDNWFAVTAVDTEKSIESIRSKALRLYPVSGVAAFPFFEDFEAENNAYITLQKSQYGNVYLSYDPDEKSNYLKMEGTAEYVYYSSYGTGENVIANNSNLVSTAKIKSFSTADVSSLIMSFDLKQTMTSGPNDNVLCLYVNGMPVADVLGTTYHHAQTASSDKVNKRYYDLTSYVGSDVEIEFKGVCHYASGLIPGADQGDVIFIDNIKIYEKPLKDMAIVDLTFPGSGLNKSTEDITVYVANLGSEEATDVNVSYELFENGSSKSTNNETISDPIASMTVNAYTFGTKADMSTEDALYYATVKVEQAGDVDVTNDNAESHKAYNYGDIVPMSYNGATQTKTVDALGLVFTDGGTRVMNYPDNTESLITFEPADPTKKVQIDFTQFALEKDYDYLILFSGREPSSSALAVLNGALSDLDKTTYISTALDGSMTVAFRSDAMVNEEGWIADVTMVDNPNAIDIGVAEVTNPTSADGLSNQENVKVKVANYGTQAVDNYKIFYSVNGGELREKVINESLAAGEYVFKSFDDFEDFTAFGVEYVIEAYTELTDDAETSNNKARMVIKSDYESASGGGGMAWIQNVSLCEINVTTGDNNYEDHSDQVATMEYGNTYKLTVTKGDEIGGGVFWIDWNYNGTFDDNENFDFTESEGLNLIAYITPPFDAPAGLKRLRIRGFFFGTPYPTGSAGFGGEVEDYSIMLTGTPPQNDIAVADIMVDNIVNKGDVAIDVLVENRSEATLSFPVEMTIGGDYNETIQVTDLASGASTTLTFTPNFNANGSYTIEVQATLDTDEQQLNNTLSKDIEVQEAVNVYAYSFLGTGALQKGPYKFNLASPGAPTQIDNHINLIYAGTMVEDMWYISRSGGEFYTIDITNGDITMIRPSSSGGKEFRDIFYDPVNKVMYGRLISDTESDIYTIDVVTGAPSANKVGTIPNANIRNVEFDIAGNAYGFDKSTGMLYKVNTTDWSITEIGSTGILPGSRKPAMFFNYENGKLYIGCENYASPDGDFELREVNIGSGASSLVGINYDMRFSTAFGIPYNAAAAKQLANVVSMSNPDGSMVAIIDAENKLISLPIAASDDKSALPTVFTLSPGASATLNGQAVNSGDALDLSGTSVMTVTSMDGSVSTDWTIVLQAPINTEAHLITYDINTMSGPVIGAFDGYDVTASLNPTAKYRGLTVEFDVSAGAKAYIGNEELISNVTKVDHSEPFILKVVAEDKQNMNYYLVKVMRSLNNEAEVEVFLIEAVNNDGLSMDLQGVINQIDRTISIEDVPSNITTLVPTFELSAGAHVLVNSLRQVSAYDGHDFTSGIDYVVVSEDGTESNTYTVSIKTVATDIKDSEQAAGFTVYPNPAQDKVTLTNTEAGTVCIYSITGALVLSKDVTENATVLLNGTKAGIYILKFENDHQKEVVKIRVMP
ncbi:MAG: S8 family serine peptidase [Bacteroidales bacterium]|nr:S8 family serine peptidase [Bacteroidales bacterium]